jgi:hypothetical protein
MARGFTPGAVAMQMPKTAERRRKASAMRTLRRISIEPAMNGGFVAEHSYHAQPGEYQPPETHAFSNARALHRHLQRHIPVQQMAPQPAAAPGGPGGPPPAQGPMPMPTEE